MLYDCQTRYIELVQGEKKMKSAGFLKWERRGNLLGVWIRISGIPYFYQGEYAVKVGFNGRVREIGTMQIAGGSGNLELREISVGDFLEDPAGAAETELKQEILEIKLPEDRRLTLSGKNRVNFVPTVKGLPEDTGVNKSRRMEEEKQEATSEETEEVKEKKTEKEEKKTQEREVGEEREKAQEIEAEEESEADIESKSENPLIQKTEKQSGTADKEYIRCETTGKVWGRGPENAILQPNKWEQLRAIYPVITPFGDGREYLRISPGDFVILKDKSYRLANNSFLLHGYFNYKHLILHKVENKGETKYYVGVPGNFYDKEKEVAILFGFESFECRTEPAREGDYGYYMMRVEL